jgi:hypothetical protein
MRKAEEQKQANSIRKRLGLGTEDPRKPRLWFTVDIENGNQLKQECMYDEETHFNLAKSTAIVDFGMVGGEEAEDYDEVGMAKEYILENFLPVHNERNKEDIDLGALAWWEKEMIIEALVTSNWIQKIAAEKLGITNRVLHYKIGDYGITHPSWRVNK